MLKGRFYIFLLWIICSCLLLIFSCWLFHFLAFSVFMTSTSIRHIGPLWYTLQISYLRSSFMFELCVWYFCYIFTSLNLLILFYCVWICIIENLSLCLGFRRVHCFELLLWFYVLHVDPRSLEFIFVFGVRCGSDLLFSTWSPQCPSAVH